MDAVATLIIDSNRLFREGVRQLLDGTRFSVEGDASTLAEANALIASGRPPELVLIELDGQSNAELEQIKSLRRALPDARIVVLTNRMASQSLALALEAGVDGYLLKDLSAAALAQSLTLVMIGEKVFPTQLAGFLIENSAKLHRPLLRTPPMLKGLSAREVSILRCLVHGCSNRAIAEQLRITEGSVKVHLKAVLRKIRVSNRTQAAIWALNNGLDVADSYEGAEAETSVVQSGAQPSPGDSPGRQAR